MRRAVENLFVWCVDTSEPNNVCRCWEGSEAEHQHLRVSVIATLSDTARWNRMQLQLCRLQVHFSLVWKHFLLFMVNNS